MAVETPSHRERINFMRLPHLIDLAVALFARHAFADMDSVMEINKAWQAMHRCPSDGLAKRDAGSQRFQN